jgi:hypothetical protein
MRTNFPQENGESATSTKDSPNILEALGDESEQNVKFPKRLRHRGKGKVLATIYRRPDCYRLYWRARVDGKPKSRFKDFPTYSAAKRAADKTVTDLAKGSEVPKLTPGQASDALAAVEGLQRFYQATGRRMSLRESDTRMFQHASFPTAKTTTVFSHKPPISITAQPTRPARLEQADLKIESKTEIGRTPTEIREALFRFIPAEGKIKREELLGIISSHWGIPIKKARSVLNYAIADERRAERLRLDDGWEYVWRA